MKHQFTTHHLIRYIYNELGYMERVALEKALKEDAALAAQFEQIQDSQDTIEEMELMPSSLSIQNILNYSKSSRYETKVL
jgi:hypothetical protein